MELTLQLARGWYVARAMHATNESLRASMRAPLDIGRLTGQDEPMFRIHTSPDIDPLGTGQWVVTGPMFGVPCHVFRGSLYACTRWVALESESE